MSMFKKIFSLILACMLIYNATGFTSIAIAETSFIVVTRDNAPIREDNSENASIVIRVPIGVVMEVISSSYNIYFHKWYKVKYEGKTGYIYSGNVDEHYHSFSHYTYHGVKYSICTSCAYATVTMTNDASISQSQAKKIANNVSAACIACADMGMNIGIALDPSMVPYVAAGGFASLADGPLPLGDFIGALIIGLGALYELSGNPSNVTIATLTTTLASYIQKSNRVCNSNNFYQVTRINGTLYKTTGLCLELPEAYAYVLAGFDVWTRYQSNALILAGLWGAGYSEVDANKPGYWYHYHLGDDVKTKITKAGHIFYGLSVNYFEEPR